MFCNHCPDYAKILYFYFLVYKVMAMAIEHDAPADANLSSRLSVLFQHIINNKCHIKSSDIIFFNGYKFTVKTALD